MNKKIDYQKHFQECIEKLKNEREKVLENKCLSLNGRIMLFEYFKFGTLSSNIPRFSLYIGLHGGGGCPKEVNDQQWSNHKHLYDKWLNSSSVGPCIWFVPRAPENLWNMWHLSYINDMLDYVIQTFLVLELIDVNRVYLSGYSAGGDGVYKLGPRMADRLAGAAMCGGHPNGASMLSLRNCFFSIQVGEHDDAYNRNGVALEYSKQLENFKYFLKENLN